MSTTSGPRPSLEALELFEDLVEQGSRERESQLEDLKRSDEKLAEEVSRLLEADALPDPARPRLDEPIVERGLAAGTRVGSYRIVREIGRGGMGLVYLAERCDGAFEQAVAVKVLASPFVGVHVVQRLRREAEILGRLRHPGIARIFDAGLLADETPYLVVDYVDGVALDRFCDDARLSVSDRLDVFLGVCEAVSYAHRQLVVHRDLKPANVLVGTDRRPVLLDFGIAQMHDEESSFVSSSTLTRVGGRPLTPAYASPEQLAGQPVTTQSDVYALGVTLFELLTGERPFDDDSHGSSTPLTPEALRGRRARPPSRVVEESSGSGASAVLERRSAVAHDLARELEGDLDAIVLQALHPDPERRYLSVDELAADIRAFLAGRPVKARADTLVYRATKFLSRHKLALSGVALLLLAILFGVAATVWQARVAARERDAAELAAEQARHTSAVLQEILSTPDGSWYREGAGQEARVVDLLSAASSRLDDLGDPRVEGSIRRALANSYRVLGLYETAEEQARLAVDLHDSEGPGEPGFAGGQRGTVELAESLHDLGVVLFRRRSLDEALDMLRRAAEICAASACPAEQESAWKNDLGLVTMALGRYDQALELYDQALTLARTSLDSPHPVVAITLGNRGQALMETRRFEAAEESFRESREIFSSLRPRRFQEESITLYLYGRLNGERGDFGEAVRLIEQAVEVAQSFYGERHPFVATFRADLGTYLANAGDPTRGAAELRAARDLASELHGPHAIQTALTRIALGDLLCRSGDASTGADELSKAAQSVLLAGDFEWRHHQARAFQLLCGRDELPLDDRVVVERAVDDVRTALGNDDPRVRALEERLSRILGNE